MVGRHALLSTHQRQHRGLRPIISPHLPLPPQPPRRAPLYSAKFIRRSRRGFFQHPARKPNVRSRWHAWHGSARCDQTLSTPVVPATMVSSSKAGAFVPLVTTTDYVRSLLPSHPRGERHRRALLSESQKRSVWQHNFANFSEARTAIY
jgi:hypothetical protein